MNSLSLILCQNCSEWNEYQGLPGTCRKCGRALGRVETAAEKESIKRRSTPIEIRIPINPDDGMIIRGLKHVFNFVQLIFIAVISFFFWLIAVSPG